MTTADPGRSRLAYRRLKRAAGVTDLPVLERRVGELEVAVAEERGLQVPLIEQVAGLEDVVANLLERRLVRGRTERDAGHGPPM